MYRQNGGVNTTDIFFFETFEMYRKSDKPGFKFLHGISWIK